MFLSSLALLAAMLWILTASGSLLYMLLTRRDNLHPIGVGYSVFFGWAVASAIIHGGDLEPVLEGLVIGAIVGTALGVARRLGRWMLGDCGVKTGPPALPG